MEQHEKRGKKTFRNLIAWQKAIQLAKQTYQVTQRMPKQEQFGLTAQMRRAAVSIPSNIAEGNARQTLNDYIHFLVMARGSLAELETQLIIATELNMIPATQEFMARLAETDRVLQGLIRSLQNRRNHPNE